MRHSAKIREGSAVPHLSREVIPHLSKPDNPCARTAEALARSNMVFNHAAAELRMDPTQLALINDGCEGERWQTSQSSRPSRVFRRVLTV
jgi:hypothetical protein